MMKFKYYSEVYYAMEERRLYDFIGGWLVENKGCQRDRYSIGYVKDLLIGDVRPDVFAIRYELVRNRLPKLVFHGYLVEVKMDIRHVNEVLGKLIRLKHSVRQDCSWIHGVHTLSLYIACVCEKIPEEILSICEGEGIGVLWLQVIDSKVNIYEVLEAVPIELDGMPFRWQRSIGSFLEGIGKKPYLRSIFIRPREMFYELIKPLIDEYKSTLTLYHALGYLQDGESIRAHSFLMDYMAKHYPQLELVPLSKCSVAFREKETGRLVLSIEYTRKYFYIVFDGERKYRVYSFNYIIEFDGEVREFEGDLKELVEDVIRPRIDSILRR